MAVRPHFRRTKSDFAQVFGNARGRAAGFAPLFRLARGRVPGERK